MGNELIAVDTTLLDMHGSPHRYESIPFAFDVCFDLGLELADIVGGPLGQAFKSMLLGGNLTTIDLDEQVLGQAVSALGELPGRLIARGGSVLVARILSTTTRIARHVAKPGTPGELYKQPLSDEHMRTAAFGGGNLREAIDAVRWVLTVNYGPFVMSIWEGLREPLAELATSLGLSPESMDQEPPTSVPESGEMKPTEIL